MNPETIRELLAQRPFLPFQVRLSSGDAHDVRHSECAVVTKSRLVIVMPETDRVIVCALLFITSVEMLQAA